MSHRPVRSPVAAIRALSRDLAEARDAQLTQALALLDAMPDRGAADGLIEPLRGRLAGLRPRRPLNLTRLLFSPLDPLIVPAARWRPGGPTIPRTVLTPLAETVRAGMGSAIGPIEALIKGHSVQDTEVAAAAGERLWPQAGRILSAAPPPVGWTHTGLSPSVYPPMARRIGAVLLQLTTLDALVADAFLGRAPVDADRVIAMLRAVDAQEPDAQPMMTTLLLARVPEASDVLGEASVGVGLTGVFAVRGAGEEAINLLLDQLERPGTLAAEVGRGDLAHAAAAVRRVALLLRQAESSGPAGAIVRLNALRRRLDETCRARFAASLTTELLGRLAEGKGPLDAAAITRLEASARGVRAFETEARSVGSGSHYDGLLRQAAERVQALPAGGLLSQVDRVRLVEILAGPDAALEMLGEAS